MSFITTSLPPWLLFLLTLIVGIAAEEAGSWIGTGRDRKSSNEKKTPVGSLVGAMLGLLAFMLGFTFSITASRYNERKHLVVDQAKAIGTCYLRTSLIPEKQKTETRRLFRQYIDLLIESVQSPQMKKNVAELEKIQMQIWNQTSSLKDESMDSPLRSLYIASVNEVIDLFSERRTVVLIFRIPGAIWAGLLSLYILSLFVVGLEAGSNKQRRSLNVPIMTAAFALIVVLISSMDASDRIGHFTVSQQPLVEVQKMMNENIQ